MEKHCANSSTIVPIVNNINNNNKFSTETFAIKIACYVALSMGLSINGILIIIFARSNQLRALPSNKLICSLLLSDFLIEVSFMATISLQPASGVLQRIAYVLKVLAMTLTVLNLCLIWLDRLIAVKLTFRHHRIIDSKTVIKMIAASWGIGLSLAVISLVIFSIQEETAYLKSLYVSSIITPAGFLILVAANIVIFREARIQASKIKRQSRRQNRGYHMLRLKSAYLCAAMVTAFLIFWLPHVIDNIWTLAYGTTFGGNWFKGFSAFMIICNTLAHPCLYILLNRDLRKMLIRRWRNSLRRLTIKRMLEAERVRTPVVTLSMNNLMNSHKELEETKRTCADTPDAEAHRI